jgi:hypothetical protein
MTSTAPSPARRLVLVPATPRRDDGAVRRFRLATRRLEGREAVRSGRFEPGKRSFA